MRLLAYLTSEKAVCHERQRDAAELRVAGRFCNLQDLAEVVFGVEDRVGVCIAASVGVYGADQEVGSAYVVGRVAWLESLQCGNQIDHATVLWMVWLVDYEDYVQVGKDCKVVDDWRPVSSRVDTGQGEHRIVV